jgi:DNA-binding LytR/AlgR family response regulator
MSVFYRFSAMAAAPLLPATASSPLVCVVTDDDAMSRHTLESHISYTPGLTLAGTFTDGQQLLEYLRTSPPIDVLFLDIQMPELSGLDVIRLLPTKPAVILTTGRTDFAVEAFELHVTDYLVKPVEYPRFLQAIERVVSQQPPPPPPVREAPEPVAAPAPAGSNSLFVKSGGRMTRVAHDEILYVEAVNDQAVVVTVTRQLSTNQTLRDVASRLPSPQFVRIHRTYAINRRRIEIIEESSVIMEGGRRLPIGRTYMADFFDNLNT